MFDVVMSVAVLAIVALVYGGVVNWRSGDRRRGVLMVIAALVLAGNVALWILPVPGRGTARSVVEGLRPGQGG